MHKLCQNKQMTRFRRWCRKAYAMFCSLGKCVTIGNLKKGIADVSLEKQPNVCTSFSVCKSGEKEENDGEDDKFGETQNLFENRIKLFLFQPLQAVEAALCIFLLNKRNTFLDKYELMPEGCVMHSPGFFCSNLNK